MKDKVYSQGCTLDCFDICKFNIQVAEGKIVKIEGDKNHPYTRGIICSKGKKLVDRLYHPKRITTPMKKYNGQWEKISFAEAIDIIGEKLLTYKKNDGSASVIHYCESGSGGLLKSIPNIFFNFFGGITLPKGSTCWGAGTAAQKYDFGDVRGHHLADLLNAKHIFLWGRNPASTSIHLMDMVNKARKQGARVIVIDPLVTQTAEQADIHVRVNPGTDGALAMAMTKVIINQGLLDKAFIEKHICGFDAYKNYLDTLTLEALAAETGIDAALIAELAVSYARAKPSAIYIGYGMQKYKNGGNSVRAIDAMAAITGNIGIPGGGVNYANRVYPGVLNTDPYDSSSHAVNMRYFNVTNFAGYVMKEEKPPVKCMFVSIANPLAQLPDLNRMMEAFEKIEFKVCIDMFLTDTANACDLFLPCTSPLESEDLVYSSMNNPYLIYNEKVIEPENPLLDEYNFFQALAVKMGMTAYPTVSKHVYLEKILGSLKGMDLTLDDIKNKYITVQDQPVAWHDYCFKTPSGKIELYSDKAAKDGLSPVPIYTNGIGIDGHTLLEKSHARLITVHPHHSLFTQHYLDTVDLSAALISPRLAQKHSLNDDAEVLISSERGEIKVKIKVKDDLPDGVIVMNTGWWNKHGNPNFLIKSVSSDMGGQIAYNETFVQLTKL